MSKADGQSIVMQFTQPLNENVLNNEGAFSVTGQEYDYVPEGKLVNGVYTIDKVDIDNAANVSLDLLNDPLLASANINRSSGAVTIAKRGHSGITAVGSASITTADKVFGEGSAILNGSTSYISIPDSTEWYLGKNPFTIEFRVKFNSFSGRNHALYTQHFNASNWISITTYGSTLYIESKSGGTVICSYSCSLSSYIPVGQWAHIALTRNGATMRLYIDGTQRTLTGTAITANTTFPDLEAPLTLGYSATYNRYLYGLLDEVRISNVERWSANFTVPNTAYEVDENTLILLHCDGIHGSTTFIDAVQSDIPEGLAEYALSGLSSVTDCCRSIILWSADVPQNATLIVNLIDTDTGQKYLCTNGGALPTVSQHDDLSLRHFNIELLLSTTTQDVPSVYTLSVVGTNFEDLFRLRISMKVLERFARVEGNLTVSYDNNKGTLSGIGGPVKSFSIPFLPTDLVGKPNVNDPEHIEMSIEALGTITHIYYSDAKVDDDHMEIVSISATGVLTNINNL